MSHTSSQILIISWEKGVKRSTILVHHKHKGTTTKGGNLYHSQFFASCPAEQLIPSSYGFAAAIPTGLGIEKKAGPTTLFFKNTIHKVK